MRSAPVASLTSAQRSLIPARVSSEPISAGSSALLVVLNSSISSVREGSGSVPPWMRPDQRDGLAQVADIVVRKPEQVGIDLARHHVAQHRRLDVLEGQRPGEDGEGKAAVGVGRAAEILGQRLDLAVARGGQRQEFEQLREGLQSPSSSPSS